ncbi:hypothetical protein TCAP_06467 [Tolypocladium capitatum]|uniref:Uncharacterized protein n=1 Tax=Tolypocladium capitatum TaxID=45235 RepID=A0A2K3Q7T1_9HYPO|nr:hypothetical protein TCAP_06467 [Tolypocladium capitatum]
MYAARWILRGSRSSLSCALVQLSRCCLSSAREGAVCDEIWFLSAQSKAESMEALPRTDDSAAAAVGWSGKIENELMVAQAYTPTPPAYPVTRDVRRSPGCCLDEAAAMVAVRAGTPSAAASMASPSIGDGEQVTGLAWSRKAAD